MINTVPEGWGPAARCSEANSQPRMKERKVCFISDADTVERQLISVQRLTPCTGNLGKSCYKRKEEVPAETAQSALTAIFKFEHRGLASAILAVLGTVDLQFQGQFVSISLRPALGIVAAPVMATVWPSCH